MSRRLAREGGSRCVVEMTIDDHTSSLSTVFSVKVDELKNGPMVMKGDIALDWLRREFASCEYGVEPLSARVNLTVEEVESGVLVRGEASVRATTECGICLASLQIDLEPEISSFLARRDKIESVDDDEELTPEDLEREWYSGDTLVLDDMIRDAIMLELPMNPRCAKDCSGLPLQGDEEKNERSIDPRLAPLASILISKEK